MILPKERRQAEFCFQLMILQCSEMMKCYGCGTEAHLIFSCPDRVGESWSAARVNSRCASLSEKQSITQEEEEESAESERDEQKPTTQ